MGGCFIQSYQGRFSGNTTLVLSTGLVIFFVLGYNMCPKKISGRSTMKLVYIFCLCTAMMFFACSKEQPKEQTGTPDVQTSQTPAKTGTTGENTSEGIRGIDVSHFSEGVDWQEVKSQGYGFAFAKATEGNDYLDPKFNDNWPAMKQAGLIRGAYHFYVTEDEPQTQAEFFIKTVKLEPGDFAPVVDIETIGKDTPSGLIDRVKTFLSLIEKHYGITPIIYTGLDFWDENMNAQFGNYPLWIAEYGVSEPVIPKGWKDWHIWQWKESTPVKGVEKNADLNIFNHKEKDFDSLLVK